LNIISSAKEYFEEEVFGVVGGSHLISVSDFRLNKTINELKDFKMEFIVFGHCTGVDAICRFKKEFGDKFQVLESGKTVFSD